MTSTRAQAAGESHAELLVRRRIDDNRAMTERLLEGDLISRVAVVAGLLVAAYRAGGKVLLFGNGGSAADAQHLAAEMCGRFLVDRRPLPAIALGDNVSSLTAIGNDYAFGDVFSRQVEGLGRPGDVAIGISTSGESENVVNAIEAARRNGLVTVGLTGEPGGRLRNASEHCICVPSGETPRIQEAHGLVGHILCELVEAALFGAP